MTFYGTKQELQDIIENLNEWTYGVRNYTQGDSHSVANDVDDIVTHQLQTALDELELIESSEV